MKIASLISGGVDSSTALYLLKEKGFTPEAFYLKIWIEDDLFDCPWKEDLDFAKAVTRKLDIKLHIIPMQKEYFEKIIKYTVDSVQKGLTPNPDVFCNTFIKFGLFYEKYASNFDQIATGHYAQKDKTHHLLKATDPSKDQAYFLSQLSSIQLSKAIFPIGHLYKKEVREIARKASLKTHNRPDSQGLCFLGKINFNDFLKKYVGEKRGQIVDIDSGKILKEHQGHWFYTIGQREGLKIGGAKEPYYVCRKNSEENTVFVCLGHNHSELWKKEVTLKNLNILDSDFSPQKKYTAQFRYHSQEVEIKITDSQKDKLTLELESSYFGIASGQIGVIYENNKIVLSGIID